MVQFAKYGPKTKDQCLRLFDELNKYRTLPKISKEDFELIFDELDDSHDFKINAEEFDDLCHAIALKFSKEDCPSCFEYIPSVYYSAFSEKLKTFIRSDTFANIIAFILVINLIAVIIETTLDIADSSSQQVWQVVEFVFVGLPTFHSGYDFGYLLKLLTCRELPETQAGFFNLINIYFPVLYDIKHLMKFCNSLHGGLNKLAELLEVERIGICHQAGSDSLLTCFTFMKLMDNFFNGSTQKYVGVLYGLGVEDS